MSYTQTFVMASSLKARATHFYASKKWSNLKKISKTNYHSMCGQSLPTCKGKGTYYDTTI